MRHLVVLAVFACGPSTPDPQTPPKQAACPQCPTCESAKAPELKPLDEAQLKALSAKYFDAWGKHDVAALTDMLASGFIAEDERMPLDRDAWRKRQQGYVDDKKAPFTFTWDHDLAFVGPTGGVYITEGTEHRVHDYSRRETLVWTREGAAWKLAYHGRNGAGLEVERETWNDVYRAHQGFKQQANQLLVDTLKGKKSGTALDLASGQGRNALYMAKQGLKTTAVDISDEGLLQAMQAAAKDNLKLDTVEANADEWDVGTNKWDVITMLYAGADPTLVGKAKPGLKKGGLFIYEFFAGDQMGAPPGFPPDKLAAEFKDGFKILKDEVVEDTSDWGQAKLKLQRFVAQKQ